MTEIETGQCKVVNVSQIVPSEFNAREQSVEATDSSAFIELCDSIKSDGLIEPIIVRSVDGNGKYEAVAGTRRLHALQHLGVEQAPVVVRKMSDNDVRIASMVENIHRNDLNEDEKEETLKAIYLNAWDEWKPKNWYEIMPREKNPVTNKIEIFDCSTGKGKLVLAKQYLNRIHSEKTKGYGKKVMHLEKVHQIIFPTKSFKELRERIGYSSNRQSNILRGLSSAPQKESYIEELPPILRQQFDEDERIKKLAEEEKKALAKKIHMETKPKKKKTKAQKANQVTEKFFKDLQNNKAVQNKEETLKLEEKKPVAEAVPKLATNPVRARENIILECLKLFKLLTTMDLETGSLKDGEMQARSTQAKNSMKEITTYYIQDRVLANLQNAIIPTYHALSTFRDLIYESIEAEKRKDELLKP